MKIYLNILLVLFLNICIAQTESFDSLLLKGKEELKKDFEEQDFNLAIKVLKEAVKIRPDNTEAKYFLGYAYSRLNAKDGGSMNTMNLDLVIKSSEQFEDIIVLTPKYTGEEIVLDPYAKITSEWGSMAMSYWHKGEKEKAIWAFKEGKKRGGFSDFILFLNKNFLETCTKNSILITSGDLFTLPLWYLQIVENVRKDVTAINVSLLESTWYPSYLLKDEIVEFDVSKKVLDTLQYKEWVAKEITISNISWTVKPSYNNQYLLRADLVLLSLLKANKFKKDVFFTKGFARNSNLSLTDNLVSYGLVDKVEDEILDIELEDSYEKIDALESLVNRNSPDEMRLLKFIKIWL